MLSPEVLKKAHRIRAAMKNAGYTKGIWPAALKSAYRFDSTTIPENKSELRTYRIIKKDGTERTIRGFMAKMEDSLILLRDYDDDTKWKSFRTWQLLPKAEQPRR